MSWSDVFNFIWAAILIIFWLCALSGALILGFVIIVGSIRGIRQVLKPLVSQEKYQKEAVAEGARRYGKEIFPAEFSQAFVAGASWGRERLTK